MLNKNMHNVYVGGLGEATAIKYLKKLGHIILEKNYRGKGFEIDIISKDGNNEIHFIEVKTRKNTEFGYAWEYVTPKKLEKIKRGAIIYLKTNKQDCPIHFDVIEVYGKITAFGFKCENINYIKDVVC